MPRPRTTALRAVTPSPTKGKLVRPAADSHLWTRNSNARSPAKAGKQLVVTVSIWQLSAAKAGKLQAPADAQPPARISIKIFLLQKTSLYGKSRKRHE